MTQRRVWLGRLNDAGSTLVEFLVAMLLFSVMALTVLRSTVLAVQNTNRTVHDSIAMRIAQERIENLAAVDPETLDDGDDVVETIGIDNKLFEVNVDVTIEADRTRAVEVTVTDLNVLADGSATVRTAFALWGVR